MNQLNTQLPIDWFCYLGKERTHPNCWDFYHLQDMPLQSGWSNRNSLLSLADSVIRKLKEKKQSREYLVGWSSDSKQKPIREIWSFYDFFMKWCVSFWIYKEKTQEEAARTDPSRKSDSHIGFFNWSTHNEDVLQAVHKYAVQVHVPFDIKKLKVMLNSF